MRGSETAFFRQLRESIRRRQGWLWAFVLWQSFFFLDGASIVEAREQHRLEVRREQAVTARMLGRSPMTFSARPVSDGVEPSTEWLGDLKERVVHLRQSMVQLATESTPESWASRSVASLSSTEVALPQDPEPSDPRAFSLEGQKEGLYQTPSPSSVHPTPLRSVRRQARRVEGLPGKSTTVPVTAPVQSRFGAPSAKSETMKSASVQPSVAALAADLDHAPVRLLNRVGDGIGFDPKWGAESTPAGTLMEGTGTSWDQAWLLHDLLLAGGVDSWLEWGEVEIPADLLQELTGIDDAIRAGDFLTTAGLPTRLIIVGGTVQAARFPHVWVKAHLDYTPNRGLEAGNGDTWVRLDPTLKGFERIDGLRLDDQVSFSLGDHLESGTEADPRPEYEAALLDYATGQALGIDELDGLRSLHRARVDEFPFVPGTSRAKVVAVAGESQTVPERFQARLDLELRDVDGAQLASWTSAVSAVHGGLLELRWPGASAADQATLDFYGGVFAAPPFEVELRPSLRLNGVEVAAGSAIGSAEDAILRATMTPPADVGGNDGLPVTAEWELFAGEHGVLAFDLGAAGPEMATVHAAAADGATDPSDREARLLAAAGQTYLASLAADLDPLASLRWHRAIHLGTAVLAVRRGAVSRNAEGSPETFGPGPLVLETGVRTLGLMPVDGRQLSTVPTLELLGSQGSVREGEALEAVFGGEHVTAVGFLKEAVRRGQTLTRVEAGNLDAALSAAILSSGASAAVRFAVERGAVAWIPESQLDFGPWTTTGYIIEDPETGAGGYFVTYERLVVPLEGQVTFHNISPLQQITSPTPVVASIDAEGVESWALSVRSDDGTVTPIAAGTGPVGELNVGTFDPTELRNGLYVIQLKGVDGDGRSVVGSVDVIVDGELKIGHFVLPLLDMRVPVLGLPFDVARVYDSKDRSQGDFGHGWRLQTSGFEVTENTTPGLGWRGTVSQGPFATYCIEPVKPHVVVVRFPDDSIGRFQPRLEPSCQALAPPRVVTLQFVPLAGTRAVLDSVDIDGASLLVNGSFPGPVELFNLDTVLPYDPEAYRVTTATTAKIDIHEDTGLQRIQDPNGNVMEVSDQGFVHSRGVGLDFTRDDQGRITAVTDPSGDVMTYDYDEAGDLVRMTDRAGRPWRYTYHDDHFLATIIDPNGIEQAAYSYDGDDRWTGYCEGAQCLQYSHETSENRERITDAQGNEASYVYDNMGNVISMTNLRGETIQYEYNDFGDLTRQENPDGGVITIEYDERRNRVKQVDPHPQDEPAADFTTTYAYNSRDQVTRVDFPRGTSLHMFYDGNGNLLRQEDGDGNLLAAFTYGPGGVITSETDRFGTTTFEDFNPQGAPRKMTDPHGVVTLYTYDADGNELTRSNSRYSAGFDYDGLGRETKVTYSNGLEVTNAYALDDFPRVTESSTGARRERLLTSAGQVRGMRLHNGGKLDYGFNDEGLVNEVTRNDGVSTWERDVTGRIVAQTDVRGNRVAREFDSMGRVTSLTNGLGHRVDQTYDVAGRPRSYTNGRRHTWTTGYTPTRTTVTDPLGREEAVIANSRGLPIRRELPGGHFEEIEYLHLDPLDDPEQTPTLYRDVGGRVTRYAYNAFGHLETYTNPAQEQYQVTWDDGLGRMTSLTGPLGNQRTFAYDSLGQLESVTFGDGGTLQFTTNLDGNPETKTLPSGVRFDFTYDAGLRPTGWTTTAGESATLVWDNDGFLVSDSNGLGTTTYTQDGPDLGTISHSDGSSVTYDRDILGRLTSVQAAAGGQTRSTSYGYDAAGNLISVVDPTGGETTMVYDEVNRLTLRTLPNGVATSYGYNDLDQVTSVEHRNGNGDLLRSVTYERHGIGEPTKITREDGSYVNLVYDDALRLTQEAFYAADGSLLETVDYTYDTAGNRLSRSSADGAEAYGYISGNRLASVTRGAQVTAFTHDADGRIVTRGSGAEARTYVYDSLDRLTRVLDSTGAEVASYGYDVMGRRIQTQDADGSRRAVVAAVNDDTRPQTHLLMDNQTVLAAFAFAHEKPLMRTGAEGTFYYLHDANGTVIGLVDAAGNDVADFTYDGFGNLRSSSGPAADLSTALGGDYRFHGEWLDGATDLYYLRARVYDSTLGRFLSRDAAEASADEPESLNGYVFAGSNPHVYADPTGLFSVTEVNISGAIQNITSSLSMNQMRRYALRKGREAAADAAIEFIKSMLQSQLGPLAGLLEKTLSFIPGDEEQGLAFEGGITDILCKTILRKPAFAAIANSLFLEVPMSKDPASNPSGEALGNGYANCTPDGGNWPKVNEDKKTNPDYVLALDPPYDEKRGKGRRFNTILLGDFKRKATSIKTGTNSRQFETIVGHAKHYGFFTVLYITMFRGSGPKAKSTHKGEPKAGIVNVYVLTLLGGGKSKKR